MNPALWHALTRTPLRVGVGGEPLHILASISALMFSTSQEKSHVLAKNHSLRNRSYMGQDCDREFSGIASLNRYRRFSSNSCMGPGLQPLDYL